MRKCEFIYTYLYKFERISQIYRNVKQNLIKNLFGIISPISWDFPNFILLFVLFNLMNCSKIFLLQNLQIS